MTEITPVPPFDPYEQMGNVGPRWTRWKSGLQYYIDARGITAENRKRELLLHLVGPAVQDIFQHLRTRALPIKKLLIAWTRILLRKRIYSSNGTPFVKHIKQRTKRPVHYTSTSSALKL